MYVNVNKVHAFLNFFSDENRLSDVKDLWDIFLMTKKNPQQNTRLLSCIALRIHFFLSKISFRGRLLILEIGRVMPYLPALLGQLGAARECL